MQIYSVDRHRIIFEALILEYVQKLTTGIRRKSLNIE